MNDLRQARSDAAMPEPHSLTEEEWFAIDWPLDDLERQFRDPSTDEFRREHAFHRYWMRRLALDTRVLGRKDLASILDQRDCSAVVGNVLVVLLRSGRIGTVDVPFAASHLEATSWAGRQFHAYLTAHDPGLSWRAKLEGALDAPADWLVGSILASLPPDQYAAAAEIVAQSGRPKRAKQALLRHVSGR